MTRISTKPSSQAGISLVELLVVCAVIAVVASMALLQRGPAPEQFRRQAASRELKSAFERARFDAVKRRASTLGTHARVTVAANAFTLETNVIDANNDCTPESSTSLTTTLPPGIVIDTPAVVRFNQRGEALSNNGLIFRVCNGACAVTPSNENSDLLVLTPTGTVNLLGGGETAATFGTPTIVADTSGSSTTERNQVLGYVADSCVSP